MQRDGVEIVELILKNNGRRPQRYPSWVISEIATCMIQGSIGRADIDILNEVDRLMSFRTYGYQQQPWSHHVVAGMSTPGLPFGPAIITAGPSRSATQPQSLGPAYGTPTGAVNRGPGSVGHTAWGWVGRMCSSPPPMESSTLSRSSSMHSRVRSPNRGQMSLSRSTMSSEASAGTSISTSGGSTRQSSIISEATIYTPMTTPASTPASDRPDTNSSRTCSLCGEVFSTPSNRWRHQESSCKQQPKKRVFECNRCDAKFTRKEHMKKHEERKHRN
ncbi:hypothetical protein BFW01_g7730 [Lasiodiplodia theobromae]|nr:hypothetical protein BFW01_g7730 [Lasiodiplodia theobromae]